MANTLKLRKVSALPSTFEGSTLYLVKSANGNLFDMYLSTDTGSGVRRIISETDIMNKISQAIAAFNSLDIVANIAARNALNPTVMRSVMVLDATGDPTVKAGAATYIWNTNNNTWNKISESESLDVVLTWASIQNKPLSTIEDIDDAVNKAHVHLNKTVIDQLSDAGGKLQYGGQPIRAHLEQEDW